MRKDLHLNLADMAFQFEQHVHTQCNQKFCNTSLNQDCSRVHYNILDSCARNLCRVEVGHCLEFCCSQFFFLTLKSIDSLCAVLLQHFSWSCACCITWFFFIVCCPFAKCIQPVVYMQPVSLTVLSERQTNGSTRTYDKAKQQHATGKNTRVTTKSMP